MINDPKPTLAERPIVILAGGILSGALAAVLLPRSARETEVLGPLGTHLRRRAGAAAKEAQKVTVERLDKLGINREFAAAQLRVLALNAAALAGVAALRAARNKGTDS